MSEYEILANGQPVSSTICVRLISIFRTDRLSEFVSKLIWFQSDASQMENGDQRN